MQVQVHITAGKQIKDTLAARLRDLKLGISGVFLAEAQAYRSQAQARAPADTGKLRAGIRVTRPTYRQSSTDRRFGTIRAGVRTTAPYSRLVEFGTIRKTMEDLGPLRSAADLMAEEESGGLRSKSRLWRNQQRRISRARRGARKLPPITHGSGLAAWAERKGINRWALQRAIGGRMKGRGGGSKGKAFWYPVALSEPARINPIMLAMARRVFA